MAFWDLANLDLADPLNATIWLRSPTLQQGLQPPTNLHRAGMAGAQQAMLDSMADSSIPIAAHTVLPWVPDLVGGRWREPGSLLVVGSAYAGFITEYSRGGRARTMGLADYAGATSAEQFQRQFVRDVVAPDCNYYGPTQLLAEGIGIKSAANLAILDLCRASFVERGEGTGSRSDAGGDGVVKRHAATFATYVDCETVEGNPADWTWARITGGDATRIVALGSIAEHGLLRLFHRRGMRIHHSANPAIAWEPRAYMAGEWVHRYADSRFNLRSWLEPGACWVIGGVVEGRERTWHLLPVFHPARFQGARHDPGYRGAIGLLNRMVRA